jgi:hypothetical protein
MSGVIYALCALTASICAWLLFRAYRARHNKLLFWSGVFFGIQTLNNILLVLDKLIFPHIDMSIWRHTIALLAIVLLLYGLIMRSEID